MRKQLPHRFWIQLALGLVSMALLLLTVVWSNWIELVFQVDPDNGSGAAEWLIVVASCAASIVFFALASYDWRKVAALPA